MSFQLKVILIGTYGNITKSINIRLRPHWSIFKCQNEIILKFKDYYPPHKLWLFSYENSKFNIIHECKELKHLNTLFCYICQFDMIKILKLAPQQKPQKLMTLCLNTINEQDSKLLLTTYDIPYTLKTQLKRKPTNTTITQHCLKCNKKFDSNQNYRYCSRTCALKKHAPITLTNYIKNTIQFIN